MQFTLRAKLILLTTLLVTIIMAESTYFYTIREMKAKRAAVEDQIENARVKGVRFVPVTCLVRRISMVSDIIALYDIIRMIQKEKPDIVHTHTSKAGILGRLAAKLAGVPWIVHTAHGHVFYGHFGKCASKLFLFLEKLFARFTDRLIALTRGEANDYQTLAVSRPGQLEIIHSGVDISALSAGHWDNSKSLAIRSRLA